MKPTGNNAWLDAYCYFGSHSVRCDSDCRLRACTQRIPFVRLLGSHLVLHRDSTADQSARNQLPSRSACFSTIHLIYGYYSQTFHWRLAWFLRLSHIVICSAPNLWQPVNPVNQRGPRPLCRSVYRQCTMIELGPWVLSHMSFAGTLRFHKKAFRLAKTLHQDRVSARSYRPTALPTRLTLPYPST
jgi:hypothetical protein